MTWVFASQALHTCPVPALLSLLLVGGDRHARSVAQGAWYYAVWRAH